MPADSFENEITILIKSFDRKHGLNRLINSVRKKYKKTKIIIVDDSNVPIRWADDHVMTINLEFNSGLSMGRNIGLSLVDTPYFLLCDDDFIFWKKSDIRLLTQRLIEYDADISAGLTIDFGIALRHFYGTFLA